MRTIEVFQIDRSPSDGSDKFRSYDEMTLMRNRGGYCETLLARLYKGIGADRQTVILEVLNEDT